MKLLRQALIALGITSVGLTGCVDTKTFTTSEVTETETVKDITLTREQLDKMLEEIAKKPAKPVTTHEAMCYMMFLPPERMEYLCPLCNTKTLHAKKEDVNLAKRGQWYGYLVEDINRLGVTVTLDATDLCSQCRQDKATDSMNFYIEVRVGERVIRTLVEDDDFFKIIAFLEKEDTWETSEGFTTTVRPLKPELPRIRKILGMDDGKKGARRTLFQ